MVYALYLLLVTALSWRWRWATRAYHPVPPLVLDLIFVALWIATVAVPLPSCRDLCSCPGLDAYGECTCRQLLTKRETSSARASAPLKCETPLHGARWPSVELVRRAVRGGGGESGGRSSSSQTYARNKSVVDTRYGLAAVEIVLFLATFIWCIVVVVRVRQQSRDTSDLAQPRAAHQTNLAAGSEEKPDQEASGQPNSTADGSEHREPVLR